MGSGSFKFRLPRSPTNPPNPPNPHRHYALKAHTFPEILEKSGGRSALPFLVWQWAKTQEPKAVEFCHVNLR